MATRRSRKQIVLKDPRAVRALAHPARLTAIEELFSGRVATATELAKLVELTPSAMSYHLRALEKWGIVVREPASSDGRERPWRAAGSGLRIDEPATAAGRGATTLLGSEMIAAQGRDLRAYLEAEGTLPKEWRTSANLDSATLMLTHEEADALSAELSAAVDRYRKRRSSKPPAGSRRVRAAIMVVPLVD